MSSATDSPQTLAFVNDWLRICENHGACNSWRKTHGIPEALPARLIDVGTQADFSDLKLILSNVVDSTAVPYATLSHCWGTKIPFRLTSSNLEACLTQVTWSHLPQTFQDAVLLIRQLHLRYIWIDALCIIQDSLEDWKLHAEAMGSIYGNAWLNIAAAESVDSSGGLFRNRDPALIQPYALPSNTDDQIVYLYYANRFPDDVSYGPLTNRAWVSPRFSTPFTSSRRSASQLFTLAGFAGAIPVPSSAALRQKPGVLGVHHISRRRELTSTA